MKNITNHNPVKVEIKSTELTKSRLKLNYLLKKINIKNIHRETNTGFVGKEL